MTKYLSKEPMVFGYSKKYADNWKNVFASKRYGAQIECVKSGEELKITCSCGEIHMLKIHHISRCSCGREFRWGDIPGYPDTTFDKNGKLI